MVVFDAIIFLPFLSPAIAVPKDPSTGEQIESFKERIDFLIQQLDASRTKIIIPTPALSEVLVHADQAGPEYLNLLQQSSVFRIESFDQRAAVEVAFMIREAIVKGDKRSGSKEQ